MSTVDSLGSLAPSPAAAPRRRVVLAQTGTEIRLSLSRGEQLLLTLVVPVLVLVGVSKVSMAGSTGGVQAALPGALALAVVSTAFTGQAIATGFERRYGVLKLLGVTPLGRSGLVLAKTLAVLAVEAIQVVLLVGVALALGWHSPGAAALAGAGLLLLLGTAAFSALGLLLAGTLRAEATLAVANGIYLVLLLGAALVIPVARYPAAARPVLEALPSGALGEGLRIVLEHGQPVPLGACAVLLVWAVAGWWAAARWFRWD